MPDGIDSSSHARDSRHAVVSLAVIMCIFTFMSMPWFATFISCTEDIPGYVYVVYHYTGTQ